ncbi:MAG: hypothetical protein R3Y06_06045 [Faecalibacterium sp.]
MPDYKKLYFDLFRANAAAAAQLVAAQEKAEATVMDAPNVLPLTFAEGKGVILPK